MKRLAAALMLAGPGMVDGKQEWMLVCSVHEAR